MDAPVDPARRGALEALLSPLSVATFMADYWGRRSAYLRAEAGRLGGLSLDSDRFFEAVARPAPQQEGGIKVQYFDPHRDHVEFGVRYGDPTLVRNLLASGMTICATDFDAHHPPLRALALALARDLGAPEPFDVACYASSHRQGFGLHFDSVPVLVVQCEGQKRWWYGPGPSVVDPPSSLVATNHDLVASFARRLGRRLDVPSDEALIERVLSPGDVLFLPPGTWHRTEACGFSLGLTFTLSPRRSDAQLVDAIRTCVEDRAPWRPTRGAGGDGPCALDWRRRRIQALKRVIAALEPDDILAVLCGERPPTGSERARTRELAPTAAGSEPAELTASTTLSVAARTEVSVFTSPGERGERSLFVCGRDERALELWCEYASFVESILSVSRFSAGDAVQWLPDDERDWEVARALLEALRGIGVVEAVRPPQPPRVALGPRGS